MNLDRIGKYRVVERIGQGTMGEVFKAHDPFLNRYVAVKTITPALAGDPEFRQRFQREAQSAAQLNHPNIVTIYEFGNDDAGLTYMAMELLEGVDLREAIRRRSLGHAPPADRPRRADLRRPRLRARAWRRAPRPQARKRPHPADRAGEDPRLRSRPPVLVGDDEDRQVDGDTALHVPRAGAGPEGGCMLRRVLARRPVLRGPHPPAAVRGWLGAGGPPGDRGARPRAAPAPGARHPAGDRGHRRARARARPRPPLPRRPRDGARPHRGARGARRRVARAGARGRGDDPPGPRRDDAGAAPAPATEGSTALDPRRRSGVGRAGELPGTERPDPTVAGDETAAAAGAVAPEPADRRAARSPWRSEWRPGAGCG